MPLLSGGNRPVFARPHAEGTTTSSPELQIWQLGPNSVEGRQAIVARGERRCRNRPGDPDGRIVPGNADLAARVVHIGALVFDLRDRRDDAESVRESRRDEALLEIRGGQVGGNPRTEGRGAAADVDGDVENLALDHPDQLSLRPPYLQMQAAQRAADRSRMIVLHEGAGNAVLAIPISVVRLEKESAGVFVDVGLDQDHARQAGWLDAHVSSRVRGCGTGTGRRHWTPWRAPAA